MEGCYSHLSGNPRRYEKNAREQARRLRTAIDVIKSQGIHPTLCHLSNSQGVMTLGDLGFDAVRVGSALIGKAAGGGSRLKPAVWLEAKIYEKIRRKKGQTVGYQSTAVLKHDSVLGLVRIGHGDGIYLGYADTPEKFIHGCIHLLALRLLPGRYKKTVQVQGRSLPIVGRLGIAHMVIDLSGTDVQIGDTVKEPSHELRNYFTG